MDFFGVMVGGRRVFIAGSFDNWEERYEMQFCGYTNFKCSIYLPCGVYEYKFIVDGVWMHDITLPSATSNIGSINNYIEIRDGYAYLSNIILRNGYTDAHEYAYTNILQQQRRRENTFTNGINNIRHALNTLIGIPYKELGELINDKINDKCAICLTDFKEIQDELFVVLECSHVYHRDCIIRVYNNSCPLCKKPIIRGY